MNNTTGVRQDCKDDFQQLKTFKATTIPNIILILITMMTFVGADAFTVDDITGKSTHSAERRSLRMPVVKEVPDNCLPPHQRRDYCVFILEDSNQVNGGTLLASNKSGDLRTVDFELGVLLGSDKSPIDVGIWVSGTSTWEFNIPGDISVVAQLTVPTLSKHGGHDVGELKKIDFPMSLETWVTVPHFGMVQAKGQDSGTAYVHTNTSKNGTHELTANILASNVNGPLSSSIRVLVENIYNQERQAWEFTTVISLGFDVLIDHLQISYLNTILLLHVLMPFKFPSRSE
ncbi:hypothetical protein Pmar_PMAR029344 [Perkinsus marinus ATCC 50983]|uniref:Uncharacterized protein n=1 Tax=Perkinsus marinus (strain ATCC 50983 / TXsc) TaxID=423536 RepID=C5KMW4_PERM5|nr:hypothetical protein Pmar_PMAR029344 [Perkinsus marinus ATCC 50983]EER14272.1 hypothetical protein Pmar_PMAR029344 [Perkinsus marinus ATCC 50983]|eukprot:XP_002782477.1 hypothetical protein Pmar_PMAR029344 [Perkinsus marinus ATCC 50983]